MALRDSADVQEDHDFVANANLSSEPTSSSSSAQNDLGHVPPGSITGRLSPDFLLFGYNQNGRTRAWRLLRSNIPLPSSQNRLPGNVMRLLYAHLSLVEKALHRPATESEAEAYAKWAYAQNRSQAQYLAVGFAAAGIFTYRGSSTFRFPLYTPPNPAFFNYFPSPRFSFLAGSNARLMWHVGVRYPLYAVCSVLASGPIGTFLSGIEAELGLRADPRTKHISEAMLAATRAMLDKAGRRSQPGATGQTRTQKPKFPNDTAGRTSQAESSTSEPTYNEMDQNTRSFEDFNRNDTYANANAPGSTDTGILTTSQMRTRDVQRRPKPSSKDPTTQGSFSMDRAPSDQYHSSSSDNAASSSASFYGDNNPPWSSSSESNSSSSSASGDSTGGSAWDRVRAGASDDNFSSSSSSSDPNSPRFSGYSDTSTSPRRQQQQQPGFWGASSSRSRPTRDPNETKADSFSFSKSEEERALAKEQAQREFDAMIEAERRLDGSGSGNEGGGGKWG